MINVNDTVKNLYSQDSKHISLFIQLGETTLTNSDFHVESMVLDEVLMAEDQLTFGGCNASRFEITLINPDVTIEKGSVIKPYLVIDGSTTKIWLGEFNVTEIIQAKDSLFRGVIALDHMFKFSTFVTEWYNGLTFPMTLKAFRDSLCNHLGIIQNTTTLPFDSLTINKYYENEEVNAVELIRNICELNGRFGKMDRNGKLSYIALSSVIVDSLDVTNQLKSQPTYFSFVTNAIDGVKIVDSDGTFYRKPDTSQNAYCFTNNRLLYGRTRSELDTIITKLMDNVNIDAVTYQPTSELKIKGMPYLETGDKVHFTSKGTNIYTYVFKRQIRGIQALTDTIRSEGNLDLQYNDNSILNQLANLNRSDERMKVEISSTAEGLQTEITRATQEEGKLSNSITTTANGLSAEITRATGKEGELATSIKATSDGLSAEVTRATTKEGQLSSSITANANSISAEVTRATTEEGKLSSSINAQAGEIALAVKKGTSYNGMKITDSGMEIKGDGALTVDMSNFKLDNNGNVTMGGNLTFDRNLYARYNDSEKPYSFASIVSDESMGFSMINFNLPQVDDTNGVLSLVESSEDNIRAVTIGYNTIFDADAYGNTSNFYDANISHKAKLPTDTTLGKVNLGNGTLIDPQSEGLGDGTIIGTLNDTAMKVLDVEKETDTRLNTLAYGEVGGKNLLNCDGLVTKTIGGITFTPIFKNGALEYINVNGTAVSTGNADYVIFGSWLSSNIVIGAGNYIQSISNNAIDGIAFITADSKGQVGNTTTSTNISATNGITFCIVRVYAGKTINNAKIYPMIRKDSITDSTYEPYIPYSVKTLATNQDNLKMLGYTIPQEMSVQNSIANGVFTQKISRVDLGSLSWNEAPAGLWGTNALANLIKKPANNNTIASCYSSNYKMDTGNNVYNKVTQNTLGVSIGGTVYVASTTKPSGYLYYELATPITKNVDGNEKTAIIDAELDRLKTNILWTNPNTTSAVENLEVTLAENVSNYKFIAIEWLFANNNTTRLQTSFISTNNTTPQAVSAIRKGGNALFVDYRTVAVNGNKATFTNCNEIQIGASSLVERPIVMIPYQIYGVN